MADDGEWVVQSIAEYLGSPEWLIPVSDFMEHKCTVFDDEDENKLTYTEIHLQYRQLVERLLESYMQEVGVGEEQFLQACASPLAQSEALQVVLQPVLAADDFQMFRTLMVQKNTELQLQALRLIQETNGALPACLTDGADLVSEMEQQEMRILKEVLRKSKEEYEQAMANQTLSEDDAGSSSTSSSDRMVLDSMNMPPVMDMPPALLTNRANQMNSEGRGLDSTERVQKSPPARQGSGDSMVLGRLRVPVKGEEPRMSGSQAAETWLEEARQESGISESFTELSVIQQEQLQQRSQYLRQQRDKLQALRREQRPHPPQELPATPAPAPPQPEISLEEKIRLQKRKHLAEKLKEEVIKK